MQPPTGWKSAHRLGLETSRPFELNLDSSPTSIKPVAVTDGENAPSERRSYTAESPRSYLSALGDLLDALPVVRPQTTATSVPPQPGGLEPFVLLRILIQFFRPGIWSTGGSDGLDGLAPRIASENR